MKISDLQQAVKDDWGNNSKLKPSTEMQLLFLIEELGEVAEAIRKQSKTVDYKSNDGDLGSEFADLIISTVTLANSYDVDLEYEIDKFWQKLAKRRKK
ncbi:MAG: MazG nucleotide pyrophosphohydrolase domain-containing protein [Candidatus Saccharimonadales bacterium]